MGRHGIWVGWEMVHHFVKMLVEGINCLEDIGDLVIQVFFEIGGKVGKLVGAFSMNVVDLFTDHFCETILHVGHNLFPEFFHVNGR